MIKGFKKFCLCLLAAGAAGGSLAGCNSPANRVLSSRQEYAEQMQAAVSTPFGAYPETVVYTLGKMISTNNSNMPAGDTYEDNKIVLRITQGSENVLNKTFTKNDFSSVVDAKFLSKSILEGIVYDKTTPQGIVYAASVCYPQTDLYMPLSITITADGKMSIQKVDMLEEDLNDEAPN